MSNTPLSPCRIYGIKNCDTMKKALAWLESKGIAYEFIDYKKTGVIENHLPDWSQRAGWKVLLNTRGLTWKRLSEEKRTHVDETAALALMREYPTLIKRPVLDSGTTLLIGFDPVRYENEFMQDSN